MQFDIDEEIKKYLKHRRKLDDEIHRAISSVNNLNLPWENRKTLLQKLYNCLTPNQVKQAYSKRKDVVLEGCMSFRQSMATRTAKQQIGLELDEWKLNDKKTGSKYASFLGLDIPLSKGEFDVVDVKNIYEGLLKPSYGANANHVYAHIGNKVLDLKKKEFLDSRSEFHKALELSGVRKWLVEEFLQDPHLPEAPARDLKFYCFYGKVALILEVVRFPEVRYCWWDSSGCPIATGQYADKPLEGYGVTQSNIKMAENVSSSIPVPFMRIDFLKTKRGMVFGEFTPRPGDFEKFNRNTDLFLGKHFLEAEFRLEQDLLSGQTFNEFKTFFGEYRG